MIKRQFHLIINDKVGKKTKIFNGIQYETHDILAHLFQNIWSWIMLEGDIFSFNLNSDTERISKVIGNILELYKKISIKEKLIYDKKIMQNYKL